MMTIVMMTMTMTMETITAIIIVIVILLIIIIILTTLNGAILNFFTIHSQLCQQSHTYTLTRQPESWPAVTPHGNNNNNNRIQRRYSRFFYNLLTALRTVSDTYAQVAQAQPCANHMQHIERLSRASVMLCATWYEGTAQLLNLTELNSHLFELYFIGWTINPMKEGRKPEYPEKIPGNELQKMPHTTARRFKPQARLEPAQ